MTDPSAFEVSLACGTAGAYTDVSAYLRGTEPVGITAGRTSGFNDTAPQVISFTLDNTDGRFTPDNSSSPLPVKVVEGMGVCVLIDTELHWGTIRSITPFFRSSLGSSAQVRITADCALGAASRTDIAGLADGILDATTPLLVWRMDDAAGMQQASDDSQRFPLSPAPSGTVTFGVPQITGLPGTQATISTSTGSPSTTFALRSSISGTSFQYPTTSGGFWNFWITPQSLSTSWEVYVATAGTYGGNPLQFGWDNGEIWASTTFNSSPIGDGPGYTTQASSLAVGYPTGAADVINTGHLISVGVTGVFGSGVWTFTLSLYYDGILVASAASSSIVPPATWTNAAKQPVFVAIGSNKSTADTAVFSRLTHTLTRPREDLATGTTLGNPVKRRPGMLETELLRALFACVPSVTLTTPTGLSAAPVSLGNDTGNVLSKTNDVIRTEQGHIYTETTGTTLSPVPRVVVRPRTRPPAISYSFSVTEIDDQPEFLRSLSNTLTAVNVNGPTQTVRVSDTSLVSRVGSAAATARILNPDTSDLRGWGEDRLQRGAVSGIPVVSFTVDARSIGRWADLGAIRPGMRIFIGDLPSQLGASSFEGWVVGKDQSHTYEHGYFTIHMDPVLPRTAVFDTDRYMADGALSLSAGINSSATTMSVATTGPKLETVDVPYDLLVDSEQVTVTACTSATPQVATITRGVNGTTAVSHTTTAVIETAVPALFAF